MRDHRGHARLLQHDFRHPHAIRIVILTPRQIARVSVVPAEQLPAKCATSSGSPCESRILSQRSQRWDSGARASITSAIDPASGREIIAVPGIRNIA